MKKIMILISVLLISAVMVALSFASDRDDGNSGYPGYHHSDSDGRHGDRDDRSGRDHDRDRYKKDDRNDWGHGRDRHYKYRHYKYPEKGYRSQPHGRHYGHSYRHENYEYRYHGHWNSWGDWERYYRIHPNRFHHGQYYHDDDGHLFFRFCDPDDSACLFYSIGR